MESHQTKDHVFSGIPDGYIGRQRGESDQSDGKNQTGQNPSH